MKFALFEFETEKSCEVGESRWIIREDPKTFNNCSWQSNKEIMVAWPREFSKVSRKIIKASIDPHCVETTTCIAKVLRFSDDYEDIRDHMKRFCETGSTSTPHHGNVTGRGQRKLKKNHKFLESDDDDDEETSVKQKAPESKKQKMLPFSGLAKNDAVEKLKAKYNVTTESDLEVSSDDDKDNCSSEEEDILANLKKQNGILQNKLEEKEKEIAHLQKIIQNLKHLPSLQDIVLDLKTQVVQLCNGVNSTRHLPVTLQHVASSQGPSSPSSQSCPSPQSCSSLQPHSSESDLDAELITVFPTVNLTNGQWKILKTKANAKDFVYAVMAMLWSRAVLFTHSITGKTSNAYKGKDAKPQLDTEKVKSICEYASKKYGRSEVEIRQIMIARISNIVKVMKAKQKNKSEGAPSEHFSD